MLKNLGKESIIYGIGQMANTAIAILILPVLTRAFTVSQVGIIDLITIIQTFGIIFSSLGVDTALTFYYWDASEENDQLKFISTAFYSQLFFSLASVLIFIIFKDIIIEYYIKNDINNTYFLGITVIPFLALFNLFSKICRILRRPILFNILTILNVVFYLSLAILFIYKLDVGIEAVFISKIISFLIIIIFSLFYFKRKLFNGIDLKKLKLMLFYGVPLLPILLIDWAMKFFDRFFINYYIGNYPLGLFSVYIKVASGVTLVVSAFNRAWGPFSMSIKKENNQNLIYAKALEFYVFFTYIAALIIQIISPLLIVIFSTEDYLVHNYLIGFLTLPIIFHGMYSIIAVGFNITKKTYFIAFGTFFAALLNIVIDIFLIPVFGLIGATAGTVFGYFFAIIFIYIISRKIYSIPFKACKIFLQTIIVLVLMIGVALNNTNTSILAVKVILNIFILALLIFSFNITKVFMLSDIKKILSKLFRN